MDSGGGMSDILNTFMSNPDMMKKVIEVLPLIPQLKNINPEIPARQNLQNHTEQEKSSVQTFAPVTENSSVESNADTTVQQTVQSNSNSGSNMSNEAIAQMVSSVLSSLGVGNTNNDGAENSVRTDVNNKPPSAPIPPTEDNTQQAFTSSPSVPVSDADVSPATKNAQNSQNNNQSNFDIEKALGVLKTVSKETSPDKDNRIKLLLALKPFMKNGRQQKIDMAIKYLNAAKVFNMFGKTGFI